MLHVSVLGLLSLMGAVWLVVRFQSDDRARATGVLVLACYLWFALSTLALAADTTLLAFRVRVPLETALACAGVLGVLDVGSALARMRPDRLRTLVVGGAALGVVAAASVAQTVPWMHARDLELAYADYYPSGVNARGGEELSQAGAWYDDLHETILAETGRQPDELVLLTNAHDLLVLHPYWGFQQLTDHYANPLADYDGRLDEVARWAEAGDSQDLIARLDGSAYRAPSVFVLDAAADGFRATLTRDAFPAEPNVATYNVVFRRELFSPDHFVQRQVGPYTVLVRR
jgi:galactan 5-O-arabinofuranosyltransferase